MRSSPPLEWSSSFSPCRAKFRSLLRIWPRPMNKWLPSHRLLRLPLHLLPHPAMQWRLPSHHQPLRHQPVCLVLQPHCYHPWLQHNHPCITRVALHILIMEKRVLIFVARGGSQIGGLRGASFATRRATLPIAALPVPYYNACCGNRRKRLLEAHGPRGQILQLPAPDGSQGPPQGNLNF